MGAIYTKTVSASNREYTNPAVPLRFGNGYPIPMGYLDALAELRKRRGMTQRALAERIGVEQPTIQRWEKGLREPQLADISKLADALGITAGALIDGVSLAQAGPSLFVKGEVAAGQWLAAYEWPQDEWQTFTGRSDVTAEIEHRFGLIVRGDSMDLLYPPGTILECVSTFGRAEIAPGKRVIVVRMDDDGQYEATVKELVEQDGAVWAVPRSSNPAHQSICLNGPTPGIAETRIAAIVVSSVRPE